MIDKKFSAIDTALQEVSSSVIRLSTDEIKRYNEHLGKVLDTVIEAMKKNEVFKYLYRNRGYTGSYYENLRISKPDEFDINLVFFLPANSKIVYERKQPGFVKIKVKSLDKSLIKKHLNDVPSLEKILESFIDKNSEYLQRTNFMQWMQGVFNKALDEVELQNTMIKRSSSGPAFTIKVSQPGLPEYSVDLVPVFEFPHTDLPHAPTRQFPKGLSKKEWTVVPKPPPDMNDSQFWRMSFYHQEREMMNDLYGMKHIIKLIKLFRDVQNWKFLSSYAIKTVFLWECKRQQKQDFWQNSVGQLFVHMLRRLSEYFNKLTIPFYWDEELNLLSKVNKNTLTIMSNRITRVLAQTEMHLNDNPHSIKKFFGCPVEEISGTPNLHLSKITDCTSKGSSSVQSNTTKSNKAVIPINLIIPPVFGSSKMEKSSFTITNDFGSHGKCKANSEERNSISVQYKIECDCGQIKYNKISDSVIEVLSEILKEQSEIKLSIQSLTKKFCDVSKEVKELQEENAHLRTHLSNSSCIIARSKSASNNNLVDLKPIDARDCFQNNLLSTNHQNQFVSLNKEGKMSTTPTKIESKYISELKDIFTA